MRMMPTHAQWPYRSPRVLVLLLYILAAAIGFALTVMAAWQLWLIAKGETTVEASDNDYYRHLAKVQGKVRSLLSAGRRAPCSAVHSASSIPTISVGQRTCASSSTSVPVVCASLAALWDED
jgi:hypothetical protein